MAKSTSKKMYSDPPKMGKDDKGNVAIIPSQNKADEVQAGTDGVPVDAKHSSERTEAVHRHVSEKLSMHHRHESEHAAGGDKASVHASHMEEMKAMNKRHEGEVKTMHARHEKGGLEKAVHGKSESAKKTQVDDKPDDGGDEKK